MIVVTVLREKLIHSETIKDNQTIKSDQSDDIWRSGSGSIQFPLSQQQQVDNHYIFTKVKTNDIKFVVRFIDTSMRIHSQTLNYSFRWLNLKWIDPRTYQWQ